MEPYETLCRSVSKNMNTTSAMTQRYTSVAQFFHWVTALLVLAAFFTGLGGSELRVYAAARDAERALHETLGMTVFVVTALRLAWRGFNPRPRPADMPAWMLRLSRLMQALLYALLLAVPLSAITGAWLTGHPIQFLGGFEVRPLLALSHAIGTTIATIHPWLGDTVVWLAGLHAAAAIYHHAVLQDGVLVSMLPRWIVSR